MNYSELARFLWPVDIQINKERGTAPAVTCLGWIIREQCTYWKAQCSLNSVSQNEKKCSGFEVEENRKKSFRKKSFDLILKNLNFALLKHKKLCPLWKTWQQSSLYGFIIKPLTSEKNPHLWQASKSFGFRKKAWQMFLTLLLYRLSEFFQSTARPH